MIPKKISKGKKYNRNQLFYLIYSRYFAFRRPLAFSILAALTPKNYEISVIQGGIDEIDFDTIDIFDETDDFIRKNNLKMSYLDVLVPFPGTPILERFKREGRILSKDWSKYDGHNYVVYQPKLMSPEILLSKTQELEKRWHTKHRSIERITKNIRFGFNNFIEVATIELTWHLNKKGSKSQNKK